MTELQSVNQKPVANRPPFLPNVCSLQAVFFLVVVTELMALALTVAADGLHHFDWQGLGIRSVMLQWISLLSAAALCPLRYWLSGLKPLLAGLLSYLLVLLMTLLCSLVGLAVMGQPLMEQLSVLAANLVLAAILGGVMLRYLYIQQQLSNQQKAEHQARLDALQARIQPHFLFNAMNSIASLISSAPSTAEKLVEDLSDLFRASLAPGALVSLSEELELCRQYLDIETVRLGERLKLHWQIEPRLQQKATEIRLPRLLLQPLLENAIQHGIQPLAEGGEISLTADLGGSGNDQKVMLKVNNPLPAVGAESAGNLMALSNIENRLEACFEGKAQLQYTAANGYFSVTLEFPTTMDQDSWILS